MPDIFTARAAVNADIKAHLDAIAEAIATAQTPTEEWPQGLYPNGLTAVLSQSEQFARYACGQLAPPSQPVPED